MSSQRQRREAGRKTLALFDQRQATRKTMELIEPPVIPPDDGADTSIAGDAESEEPTPYPVAVQKQDEALVDEAIAPGPAVPTLMVTTPDTHTPKSRRNPLKSRRNP